MLLSSDLWMQSPSEVGLFHASAKTFELVGVSDQIGMDQKFYGAAVAPSGLVVFAPSHADGVGLFDASAKTFELVGVSDQISVDRDDSLRLRSYDHAVRRQGGKRYGQ